MSSDPANESDANLPAAGALTNRKPARTSADNQADTGLATRRDLVAVHNALLKAIQAGQAVGEEPRPTTFDLESKKILLELVDASLRIESQLSVSLRAGVQRAVREVIGQEEFTTILDRRRGISWILLFSLVVNLILGGYIFALVGNDLIAKLGF